MKYHIPTKLRWLAALVGLAVGAWAVTAWAAEPIYTTTLRPLMDAVVANFSRSKWDTIMRWVNFGILVAVFFKYAKTPLSLFVKGKKEDTARIIHQLEEKKSKAEAKIKEGRAQLAENKARLEMIKARIVADGQKRKNQIVDQAHQESRRMLEGARLKIDSQIREAYNAVRLDLIDRAADLTLTKLPQMITEADHEQLVAQWMDAARK